jgi:microcystin-dependent protein
MGISSFSQQTVNAGLAALVPAGVISQFAGATAPAGYLLCQGQQVSISSHPSLHAVLGTTYGALTNGSGGAGSTHFRIPNFQGRVPVGVGTAPSGSGVVAKALAATGGDETVTLTTANMAPHTHSGATGGISANHTHGISTRAPIAPMDWPNTIGYSNGNAPAGGTSTGTVSSDHVHSFTTGNGTGTSTPVANLQPYIVVNYIIKT